jgi:hypothetical protein
VLSEWEENRVIYLRDSMWRVFNPRTIRWLCQRLLDVNEEANQYNEELQEAKDELARPMES